MSVTLFARDEYRSAEQIRLLLAEIGMKYNEETISAADEQKMVGVEEEEQEEEERRRRKKNRDRRRGKERNHRR